MIVLASELGVLQRVLDTTPLTGGQWLICLAAAIGLVVIDEAIKWYLRAQQAHAPVVVA
jgi:Ca2+-transporting ATPase